MDKKKDIEVLLGKIDPEFFTDLLTIANNINDYTVDQQQVDQDRYEEELRVNLNFDEIQSDEEQNESNEFDSENEQEVNMEDENEEQHIVTAPKEADTEELEQDELPAKSIHEFWLNQELAKHMDAQQAHAIENDILEILNSKTDIECENSLVSLLNYDKFALIKILLVNRKKIYYCTKLHQTKSMQEKEELIQQIQDDHCEFILESLTTNKQKPQTRKAAKSHQEELQHYDDDFSSMPKNIVKLDDLKFPQGAHFMSNEKCSVPKGSTSLQHKGYDEVFIPAPRRPQDEKERLIPMTQLPHWAQACFPKIKSLNRIQSEVYKSAFKSQENMLVCAPTGAGKTNVALLTMLQTVAQHMKDDHIMKESFKMVYIAPMKALVSEVVGNFSKRLEPLGLNVKELTGDSQLTKAQIEDTHLIVATPEKWDIITRKSGEKAYLELVKLIIIDEIHLLHDSRGPVLESLVSRTIRQVEQQKEQIRLVGLSATLPNYQDVAAFMRVKKDHLYYFDSSYRPIPLEQIYIGITEKKGVRRMLLANEILYEKVIERAGKCQMIIFVHSRRETVKVAQALKEVAYSKDELGKFLKENSSSQTILQSEADNVKNSPELKELLPFGFGIHHAGLNRVDRTLVEDLFADKHIQVLVSTSTLAWGVNLPAHTVIIKGTQVYSPEQGQWVELSPQDMLQMMGRAGRPKYDTKGEGIIITGYQELKYYLSLLNQQLPIESQFVSSLADQLNAEIVSQNVHTLKDAVHWLSYTYYYVRMKQSPQTYYVDPSENDPFLLQRRVDLVHSAAIELDRHNLIHYDKKNGRFQTTLLGKIASHYYLKHASIQTYNNHIRPNMSMIDLFALFAQSSEFSLVPVREEEKQEIQKLLQSVPVPIKGTYNDPQTKINVLLQAYISKFKLEGFALNADMIFITQNAGRIMRALFEIFLKRGWAQPAMIALNLSKMIAKQMWGCMTPLRQFKGIPEEILRRIEKKEQLSWDHLYSLSPQQLGETVKFPNLGKFLHKFIHQFPRIELNAFVQPITRSQLKVEMTITPDFQWDAKIHNHAEPFWIFVMDCDGETLLYSEYVLLKQKRESFLYEFNIPLFEPLHPIYYIQVISDRWLNCEAQLPISFKNLILPEKFCPPTELLDLSLLQPSALKWPQAERLFQEVEQFDSIQTQCFGALYQQDEHCFIGSNSDKHYLSLFAILRLFAKNDGKKAVFVLPVEAQTVKKYETLKVLFEDYLNKKVCLLTGQASIDNKLIESHDLVISKPEYWDIVSRRWKQRKYFKNIGLFIVDDLHLLGSHGSTLEIIVSRMRFITTQLDQQIRIVGLSTSLANHKDVAEWIGATQSFNFHPNIRSVPLDLQIQTFDHTNQNQRLQSMQKALYFAIKTQSQGRPVIVFVSDRKQARMTALDLLSASVSDYATQSGQFVKETLEDICEKVQDKNLQHVLQYGIGMIYEGISETDRQIVEDLYSANAIQILICTQKRSYELSLRSFLTIILDTKSYDGQERRFLDYSIPDMLSMLSTANDTNFVNAKAVVLCHAPKKDFYTKFLTEPFPCESHLNHFLQDHLNSEIVAKTIQNKQDCVDWITWTFLYRRLTQNPNYYNLQDVSGEYINDYLSELIEATCELLENNKCISVEEEGMELMPLNFGYISSYYYIKTDTVEQFAKSLDSQSKLQDILEVLSNSQEFELIPVRRKEEKLLSLLYADLPYKKEKISKYNDPYVKTFILIQCHCMRKTLTADFGFDQKIILEQALRLIQAIVDVMSSNGWLKPAILAIQLSQMIVQAMEKDAPAILQIPFIDEPLADQLVQSNISDIADFMNMEEEDREALLKDKVSHLQEMAEFCNAYPSISMAFEHEVEDDEVTVNVVLERDDEEWQEQQVVAPYYPKSLEENWWVLIGDTKQNKLHVVKRVKLGQRAEVALSFGNLEKGTHSLTVYCICDSYVGCDQGEKFSVEI